MTVKYPNIKLFFSKIIYIYIYIYIYIIRHYGSQPGMGCDASLEVFDVCYLNEVTY